MSNEYFSLANGSLIQNWGVAGLISTDDNWDSVPSIQGFRGDNLVAATAVDPQTVVGNDTPGVLDVNANQTNPNTFTTGGLAEFAITDPTVALNGSGTADAPYLAFYLNAEGRKNIKIQFNARDLDGSADNAIQQIATQYRLGETGTWINLAAGFVADASTGPSLASLVTAVSAELPSGANGAAKLQVRVITTNAVGNDEWIGIDDIVISSEPDNLVPVAGVTVTESGGASAVAEGGASDSYTLVLNTQPTADVTVAIAADSQASGSVSTLIFTPANWNTPQTVTVTAFDDAVVEGPHQALFSHVVTSGDAAYNGIAVGNVVVTIADNDLPATPVVNLSVSSGTGSEAGATSITVTATASAVVASNQTVTLAVTGAGISAADYYLSGATITIPSGQSSGSVTLTIADDAVVEASETAVLTIGSPSAGLTLGSTTGQNIAITNNNSSFLTKVGGTTSANGAEIAAFDPGSDRVYVVAGPVVEVFAMGATGGLSLLGVVQPGFTAASGSVALPNSVAVKNGIVAVAWAQVNTTTNAQDFGHVSFYNAADGTLLNDLVVGYLPDMLSFTPDGSKLVVANEGEPNSYGQANSFDPVGSISIIDLSGGVASATVQDAGFAAFNGQAEALRASGVRIFGPGATVAQDLEPEYVAIAADGRTALVTLQEANATALVDLDTATVLAVRALGTKDFSLPGNGFDASDRDVNGTSAGGGKVNIQNWAVRGMYQPDAIASFTVGGQTYHITANEGDSRSYAGFDEEIRVGDPAYVLDPILFPDAAVLKQNANLGRLQLTRASGDTDGDLDIDQIMAFGGRSFTIWDAAGDPVYDSGDDLEQITALRTPTLFNSDGAPASFDTRSDNKGPEPEGLAVGQIGGRTYAFVGLERVGDVMVFDVSTPAAPQFVQYINMPEDLSPEGLSFVPAADSPTGKPLLLTANEVSKTLAVFEVNVPVRIADIQGAAHTSPLAGQAVQAVPGIVTAVTTNGFYLQDPQPDANPATSEGIFVFTSSAPTVTVGSAVRVGGTVTEFRPGNNADNLTITEITAPVITPWADAPAGAIAAVVLGVDRVLPGSVINNDGAINVETGGDFDPVNEGIDFWESLEGMQVQVNNPVATSPTAQFGSSEELWVLANNGAGASSLTARGGSLVTTNDFNPERIQLDDLTSAVTIPDVDVGTRLNSVTGVVHYDFNNYEVLVSTAPTVAQASTLQREITALQGSANQLTVATFNVENLDPADGASKYNALATAIVTNLRAPDIINLEEVQDNNGATNNGVTSASETLQDLIDAIAAAGGPSYQYRQIDPANNSNGGEPGGNIRVAFLFNPDRVSFVDRAGGTATTDTTVNNLGGEPALSASPGLIDPTNAAFNSSRKPLVGEFLFNGESVFVIGNHFNSKGGDDPLFGPTQPPVLSSEVQRLQQATIVKDFVQELLAVDPLAKVIVAGDLNDFEFSNPLTLLESGGLSSLIETLPANERYTYNFQGNAQTLDHLMASASLMGKLDGFDVVHINSEFADQVSDHDPVVARFTIEQGRTITGTSSSNTLVGGAGDDTITGLQGRDRLTGGLGADQFVYRSVLDAGDIITDFTPGQDLLDVGQLLRSVGYLGSNPIGAGHLGIAGVAGRTYATFDVDGSAGPGAARALVELVGVASNVSPGVVFEAIAAPV